MLIRPYRPSDLPALTRLFYDTVHTVNAADYSPDQLAAWATGQVDEARWNASLLAHRTLVAEVDGIIAGFADMTDEGYLDRLYVHRDFQRRGIAAALCDELESGCAAPVLTTHASITARPFFEKRGWQAVRQQTVVRQGVELTNFVMEKHRKDETVMNVIDLTHVISPDMPVYPGTEGPKLSPANTYEKDGFKETLLSMYSHTGTHMDAPAHLFAHCSTLDALPAGQFAGQAVVVDCSDLGEGGRITMDYVNRTPGAAEAEYLLFRTGWGKYWGKPEYFGDYPCVTPEVVDFLIATNKKGVGLDTIGLDPIAAADLPLHRQLLITDKTVIIENLNNLDKLPQGLFTFCALPLRYENADGSPIRAVALL